MQARFDLHIHSERSHDGSMTVEQIVDRARALGLQGVAVCDHDCLFSGQTAWEDFLLIGGEEFSTPYGHLLGLFLTQPIAAKDFAGIVEAIHAQGGLAVLAHPFEHSGDEARLEPILPLLDGIEVWNGRANRKRPTANAQAAALAKRLGLPGFAGSDAHVLAEIGNGAVTLTLDALTLSQVKAALRRPGNPAGGKNGKAIHVAASQLTKRRNTHAGPLAYLKWAVFALKCVLHDIFHGK